MKIIDKTNMVAFKCLGCGEETILSSDIASLGCLKSACQGKKIAFLTDVVRRPYEATDWQKCPAGVPFDAGYMSGTITSRIYEVKKDEEQKSEEVSSSIKQFEEAEKREEEPVKKVKKENPFHAKLKRPEK